MKLKISLAVLIVLLVVGALAGVKMLQIKKLIASGKSFAVPPETVSSALVREEKWQGTLTAIGSVTAVQGVMVTPEIAGIVREIAFESGAEVSRRTNRSDRKSTRLNSSHRPLSRMPSSA